jgi:TolB-like protein
VRRLFTGIAVCVMISVSGAVPAQETGGETTRIRGERIAVLPFVNATGHGEFDEVARSLSDTLRLIVTWSGQYDVRDMEPFDPFAPDGRATMSRRAQNSRIQAVVFGRLVEISGGRIELESAVYGSAQGRILGGDKRQAFGAFDLVEAADELLLATASALLGYQVELGALLLTPSREDVPYRVYIDGVSLGDNVRVVPQVLVGRRTVEVMIRSTAGEVPVYAADHLVRPGEALQVTFSLPAVTRREQREIMVRHSIAAGLLGDPGEYSWALEALSESRRLLSGAGPATLAAFQPEQERLETIWELEREFARLVPADFSRTAGRYEPGNPLPIMPVTDRVRRSSTDDDRRVTERVRRNGYTQYYLTWLRWAEALAENDWPEAEKILADLETLDRTYGIGDQQDRQAVAQEYRQARGDAEELGIRRRRPWPYLALGAGLGAVGYGNYLFVTDEAEGKSDSRAREIERIQWGSMAVGGVVSVASIVRIVQNNRAGENALREWSLEQHGRMMEVARRAFHPDLPGEVGAYALLLGPRGEMVTIASRAESLPALIPVAEGRPLLTGRAPVLPEDETRLMPGGVTLIPLQ